MNINSNLLNNIIVLEFDFRPISDQISFEYVFGSEEYQSYTCSNYNDIFGFFLSEKKTRHFIANRKQSFQV